jgi:hypothetical protein
MMSKRPSRVWFATTSSGHCLCCLGRPNNCCHEALLTAAISEFFDEALTDATAAINEILNRLGERAPPDRELAMIDTSLGVMLAWVEETSTPDSFDAYVTTESDEEEIVRALGLQPEPTAR